MALVARIAHSINEIDPADWDALAGDHPFASYRWYRFGEAVLRDNDPIYIILTCERQGVARATLWLRRQEALPTSSIARSALLAVLKRWPLLICQSPIADTSGLILPADPALRRPALELIGQIAVQQARQHGVSFLGFVYLADETGWPGTYTKVVLPEPGTFLRIAWPDFESYLAALPKSVRKDYRRHSNRAAELGVRVEHHPTVMDLEGALRLIRNVEDHHGSAHNPWARAILENSTLASSVWLTATANGRLVACGLLLRDGQHAVLRLLGRDYETQYAYFQLVYEAIRCAIGWQVRCLWGGSGAYDMKQRLGFQLTDNAHAVFVAGNPVLGWIARQLAKE